MKTTRRGVLQGLAAPMFLQAQTPAAPPNILFILSDDHSVPYLGCYGANWMSTPNIDRFAAEGLRFDRAFTGSPQCVPSRTSLMTGRSPVAARMGRFSSPLPPDIPVAPEVLRTKGYYTGVCGRYFHLDGVNNPASVTAQVYEKYNLRTWKDRVDFINNGAQGQTHRFFDQFLSQKPAGKPWFFWINYSDPHHVWDAAAGKVDPARIKLPPHLPDLPGVRSDLAHYCGEVERMDGFFGQAMDVLRQRGEEANTLVVFMGDNGMAFPHGKGSLYDPGLNVPLIARWPGHIKPGATSNLISGEDIAATFMDAGGAALPKGATGRSFYPFLTGGSYTPREYIFAARVHHGNSTFNENTKSSEWDLGRCVRSGRYKLIYNVTPAMEYQPTDSSRDPSWQEMVAAHKAGKLSPAIDRAYFGRPRPILELYDLEQDPGELDNLAGKPEYRDIQQTLAAALLEKQIIDYDYAPPVLNEARPPQPAAKKKQ